MNVVVVGTGLVGDTVADGLTARPGLQGYACHQRTPWLLCVASAVPRSVAR